MTEALKFSPNSNPLFAEATRARAEKEMREKDLEEARKKTPVMFSIVTHLWNQNRTNYNDNRILEYEISLEGDQQIKVTIKP